MSWVARNPKGCSKIHRADQLFDGEMPTGWWVRHCGHPTATYPWYIEYSDRGDAEFCGTFPKLGEARAMAEKLYQGKVVIVGNEYVPEEEV